jgi:hypothetical protein
MVFAVTPDSIRGIPDSAKLSQNVIPDSAKRVIRDPQLFKYGFRVKPGMTGVG